MAHRGREDGQECLLQLLLGKYAIYCVPVKTPSTWLGVIMELVTLSLYRFSTVEAVPKGPAGQQA